MSPSPSFSSLVLLVSILFFALLAAYKVILSFQSKSTLSRTSSLKVVDFTNITHLSHTYFEPVLLRGIPKLHLHAWDHLDDLHYKSIKHSTHEIFTLGTGDQRHAELPEVWYEDRKGLESFSHGKKNEYRYFADEYAQPIEHEELFRDDSAKAQDTFYKMLWIGEERVSAQLHLDEPRNIFVQLKGTKTFYFLPPEEWPLVFNYPHISLHKRQSQVDMTNPDDPKFEAFWKYVWPKRREITLKEGDAIYLPPYHYHFVVADTFCVSLSFLNPGLEEVQVAKAWHVALPFDNFPMGHERILLVRLFLWMVAERISPRAPDVLLRLIYKARFEPHYAIYAQHQTLGTAFTCFSSMDWMNAQAYGYLAKYVDAVASVFLEPTVGISTAVREFKFADYAETVLKQTIGEGNVASFFRVCYG